MNATVALLSSSLLAYLAGSLPFALLTARLFRGIDIREHGSGNIGATNVARVLGRKWGILVLLLDALKGMLPVLLIPSLVAGWTIGSPVEEMHLRVACGVAAIVGHMFPCWLGFRGGKGVATALGVAVILSWQATLAATIVFALAFAISRIVSISSMLAAGAYAAAHFTLTSSPFSRENWSLTAFSLAVPALIVIRHRANIRRLLRGEEARFGEAASEQKPDVGPDHAPPLL